MDSTKLPVGFGMALAMNPSAMNGFAAKSESQQQAIIEKARTVSTKEEMQRLVRSLAEKPESTIRD